MHSVNTTKRFVHFIVDFIVFNACLEFLENISFLHTSFTYNYSNTNTYGFVFEGWLGLLLYPAYYFLFEKYWQRTPGKYLTKSIVVDVSGNPPDTHTLIIRSLIRIVPFEILSGLGTPWHDKWSKTFVVAQEN